MKLSVKYLRCFKCKNVYNNSSEELGSKAYIGLYEVKCSRCSTKWLVCPIHDQRWSRRRYCYAEEHVRTTHNEISTNLSDTLDDFHNDDNENIMNTDLDTNCHIDNSVNEDDNLSELRIDSDCTTLNKFIHSHTTIDLDNYNVNVQRYIKTDNVQFGNGIKQIVSNAFTMSTTNDYGDMNWKEIKYHIKATMFCCSLSSSQQSNFGDLCHMMQNTFYNNTLETDETLMSRIALSSKDIDRYYLKRSTSIAQNIPIPSIIELDDHACVSIIEVIQHVLYFAIPIDGMLINQCDNDYKNLVSSSTPMNSTHISDILRSEVRNNLESSELSPLIIPIILWSDDFEPNHVKQHKKSTWIKTITIAPPQDCQTSSKHTFVIALGPKDKDHEIVNHHFFKQLKKLESPTYMYSKETNSNIPIVVKVLAISADRPERCALNCMLGHGGITSRRWRYSAYINQEVLKSCKSCLKQRLLSVHNKHLDNDIVCSECYDWDYDHPSMSEPKPKEYPVVQHPDSPPPPKGREILDITNLHPIELSYKVMMDGVRFCFFNCYRGEWTQSSAMSYLKSIGINESYGKTYIYQTAIRCKRNPSISLSSIYDHIKYPVHWTSGITLDQCIDTPMHQLFQGVVKSIMEKTMSWLTKKNNAHYKAFGDFVNFTLLQIHKLNIDWCRMEKLMRGRSYTLGGWQAEQYVAFTRCSIVIYSAITDIVGNDEVGIDEHECMIQAMLCFISRLMSNVPIDSDIQMHYIKLFLSACDAFENKAYVMNGDDHMWFSKGNFLSLLNLPSQISKFGSVRLFWEGSRERSIQQIKPFLINIRQTSSYFKTKLTRMYVKETLDSINEELLLHAVDDTESNRPKHYDRYSSFKTYSTFEDIDSLVGTGKVLSVVYLSIRRKECRFYICQHSTVPKKCILYQISFCDDQGFNKGGIWYAPIEMAVSNVGEEWTQSEIDNNAEDYGILCPCITSNYRLRLSYCVICKSWKYRNKYNALSLPNISYNLFRSTFDIER